ncbi:MAG TPA: hypothetical protein VMX95_05480 [Thermodesulfobacteriota bacterium]|nr:hypothetical protein [Thermodesulfobacteriota bacterium]
MKCTKAKSLILDLVTGSISKEEKGNLELHLKDCPHCEKERAVLTEMISSLQSFPLPDPGEDFWRTLPLRVEWEIAHEYQERGIVRWIRKSMGGDWLLHPGTAAYAFVSMALVMIVTVLLFYPRYALREGSVVTRGGQETAVSVMLPGEESMGENMDGGPAAVEGLTLDQLDLVYSSLISSVEQKKGDEELVEERMGRISFTDIGSELNDLNDDELKVLSRRLYSMYPEIHEKGVL